MQYIAKQLSKCKNVNVKSQVLFVKHTGWINPIPDFFSLQVSNLSYQYCWGGGVIGRFVAVSGFRQKHLIFFKLFAEKCVGDIK